MSNTETDKNSVHCPNCGSEIDSQAVMCPECGTQGLGPSAGGEGEGRVWHKLPGMAANYTTRRNVLVGGGYGLAGLIVLGAIGGSSDSPQSTNTAGNPNTDEPQANGDQDTQTTQEETTEEEQYPNAWAYHEGSGLVFRDVEGTVGDFSTEITGEATNDSGENYEYIQISFALFDSSGAKVGDAWANTNGLDSGRRWRFEAISSETDVETFELDNITAY